MKLSITILLPVLASAGVLENRQSKGARADAGPYTYTHKDLKPQVRANSKRTITKIGPLSLVAGVSDKDIIA
jgi:hypothetical protein